MVGSPWRNACGLCYVGSGGYVSFIIYTEQQEQKEREEKYKRRKKNDEIDDDDSDDEDNGASLRRRRDAGSKSNQCESPVDSVYRSFGKMN